jgi:endo-1,4-beta-D-glucanase Y
MKKNFLPQLSIVLLILLFFSTSLSAQELGDVNNSGGIDIVDALLIAQSYVGLNPSNFYSSAADVNCNESIDIVDALLVAQLYVGLISQLPCSPQETATPTPDPGNSGEYPYAGYPYPYGISSAASDQGAENNYVLSEYNNWKSTYVTSSGAGGNLRVRRPQDSDDTVSEGMAYGMLFAVYFDDRTTFDGLWNYAKSYLDALGLMHWQIDSGGTVAGMNAATDADEDMALALIFAEKKWGSNYGTDARGLIDAIMQHEVEAGTYVLKPGDVWGGSDCTNISYYAPAFYKVFAQYTGNNEWNNVVDKCYEVITNAKNNSTGLVPDWCTASGGSAEVDWDQYKDHYYYDAMRFPMRICLDYLWFGDSRAYDNMNLITAFFEAQGPSNIKGGYYLDGGVIGNYHDAGFVATTGCGAMASSYTQFAYDMYNETKNTKSNQYYQDCLRMFALMIMTGNFPNPDDVL